MHSLRKLYLLFAFVGGTSAAALILDTSPSPDKEAGAAAAGPSAYQAVQPATQALPSTEVPVASKSFVDLLRTAHAMR